MRFDEIIRKCDLTPPPLHKGRFSGKWRFFGPENEFSGYRWQSLLKQTGEGYTAWINHLSPIIAPSGKKRGNTSPLLALPH